MNQIQEAIAHVIGVDDQIKELSLALESTNSVNALLQRQIEDIDYLNLFDIGDITEVLTADRKATMKRLRRLRQENPNAKQTVLLILRFTLGKGVELLVGPDPTKPNELLPPEADQKPAGPKVNGLFPGNKPNPNTTAPLLPRQRPQIGEQVQEEDETQKILHSFWNDKDNKLVFTSRQAMKEFLDSIITDGEKFTLGYIGQAEPYVKLSEIPVEEVDNIIYDPDNRVRPVYYHRKFNKKIFKDGMYQPDPDSPKELFYLDWRVTEDDLNGDGTAENPGLKKSIKIPAKKLAPTEQRVFHSYINPLWTKKGKRGISEIYASREWFRVHKEFMEDRAAINAAATSISYKRKIKGGPIEVGKISGTLGGRPVGYDSPVAEDSPVRKLNRPSTGSVHDSNQAVDLEWMKTDTGAQNAKEDGRALLQTAGVGAGIFVHYYGDGGDATLATAQAMELPMVKTFEDWQQWVEDTIKDLCFWVLTTATEEVNAQEQIPRVAGAFPPIVSQDVVKYMTAWSQLVQNVAPGNKIVHKEAIKGALQVMGVPNIDALMQEVEAEEVQLEAERKARADAMLQNLNSPPPSPFQNGNGNKKSPRDGSGQALPPDLKTVAKGKPEPARNGPKPA